MILLNMNNMTKEQVLCNISPSSLTIITTYSCTSACKNCCFTCSPKRKEKLSVSDMKKVINEAISSFPSIKIVIFTGGEPFLMRDELLEVIGYVANLGRCTRVVSNAYWAYSYKQAYSLLKELKKKGLDEINFSTGDEHQEFVPYENIIYACRAALDLSLSVAVNIEAHENKKFKMETLNNDIRLLKYRNNPLFFISNGLWIAYDEEAKKKPKTYGDVDIYCKDEKRIGCDTLFNNIAVSPKKQLFSCCGFFAPHTPLLQFGKLGEGDISTNYNRQFDDLLKIWLFTSGPHDIARFINRYKSGKKIDCYKKHPCIVCQQIYAEQENLEIIKLHYKEIFPKVIFNYECDRKLHSKLSVV